jgi:hypothetical protein
MGGTLQAVGAKAEEGVGEERDTATSTGTRRVHRRVSREGTMPPDGSGGQLT